MTEPKKINEHFAVTAQPGAADIAEFAAQGYRSLIGNRPDGEEPGQMPAASVAAEAQRLGMTYVHIPVKGSAITREDVERLRQALQEAPQPVVAHCRSGTRSYLLWAAHQVLHEGAEPAALMRKAEADGYRLTALPELLARLQSS